MKKLKVYSLALLLVLSVSLPATFAQRRDVKVKVTAAAALLAARAGDTITATQLRTYLSFIASDEMEGRDTPSRGLDTVAKFIAMNLSRWGFKPAGDNGTYFQKIALTREAIEPDKTTLEISGQKHTYGDDFYRVAGAGSVSGPLVFAKDGWLVKSKGIDAYQGVDVAGKIVVLYSSMFSPRTMIPRPAAVTDDDLK